MRVFVFALVSGLVALAACESVPTLEFVGDAASEGSSSGGSSGAGEAGSDARTDAGCTDPNPGGGTCCGQVWCLDVCDQANCGLCASSCAQGTVCCGKTGTVVCKAKCP